MKKTRTKIGMALFLLCTSTAVAFAQIPSTETMYRTMNELFDRSNFSDDFSCVLSLIAEKPGEPKTVHQFKLFRRDKADQTCLVKLAPEVDKGIGYLQEKDNLWTYDPVSHQFTHSSLKQRLSDTDAKVSDVNKKDTFRDNYKIISIEESKLGKFPVYVVSVKALKSDATYPKNNYFIRKQNPLILKVQNYGASGRLMRTTLIPKYVKLGKANLPVHQIYINNLNKGEKTTQIFSDFDTSNIPDMVFTKAYLEKIN